MGRLFMTCCLTPRSSPPPEPEPWPVHDHPLAKVALDPEWAGQGDFRLSLDDTFEFQLGQGSSWHGLDLLKVAANGKAVYEYQSGDRWGRKVFHVGRADLERLVRE